MLLFLLILISLHDVKPFFIRSKLSFHINTKLLEKRERSRVVDLDGPTPEEVPDTPDVIDPEDIPELKYDKDHHPVPHQPWRRGSTRGCHAPIDADWRKKAEGLITLGAATKGGRVVDITWYLTSLVITLDPDLSEVHEYMGGPEVVFETEGPAQYYDKDNPNPEDITPVEDGDYLWERDVEAHEERERRSVAPLEKGESDSIEQERDIFRKLPKLPLDRETREDMSGYSGEEQAELETAPREKESIGNYILNSQKVSTVSKGILDALEDVEEELEILDRHELIITFPSSNFVIDTQSRFDNYVGQGVIVETQDPWDSNRVLRGTLLERNSMDVIINKKGRMVTIPLNFVKCVRPAILPDEEWDTLPSYDLMDDEKE